MNKQTFIVVLAFSSLLFSKTYNLKNSEVYNGCSDMWLSMKETEVITSSVNTFSKSYTASTGLEDTILILNDIYRKS